MQLECLPDGKEVYLALCIIFIRSLQLSSNTDMYIPIFLHEEVESDQLSYLPKDTQLANGRTRSQNSVCLQSPHFPLYLLTKTKSHCSCKFNIFLPSPTFPFTTDCHVGDFESPLLSSSTGWGNQSHREVVKRNSVGRRKKWNKDLNK